MTVTIDGTTGVSLVQDGVVTAADLASGAITSGALPAGTVLQALSSEYTGSQIETTSNSLSELTTSLRVTITPASSSNKLLIMACIRAEVNRDSGADNEGRFQIWDVTNSSSIKDQYIRYYDRGGSGILGVDTRTVMALHSPNTTSATTFTLRFANVTSGAGGSWLRLSQETELIIQEIAG